MAQFSHEQIASDFNLWSEYVDPDAALTRADFDAMSMTERVGLITDTFGAEVPTVEQVLADHHLFDSVAWWDVEGGRISVSKDDLRVALEDAYDSTCPSWPSMVEL